MSTITQATTATTTRLRLARIGLTTAATSTLLTVTSAVRALAEDPIDKPDPSKAANAPGIQGLKELANVLTLYVLIGCLIGALVSALMVAFGGSLSDRLRESGKMGLIACIIIAFVSGILWAVINWAYNTGAS